MCAFFLELAEIHSIVDGVCQVGDLLLKRCSGAGTLADGSPERQDGAMKVRDLEALHVVKLRAVHEGKVDDYTGMARSVS
jgi:hypothetical protein